MYRQPPKKLINQLLGIFSFVNLKSKPVSQEVDGTVSGPWHWSHIYTKCIGDLDATKRGKTIICGSLLNTFEVNKHILGIWAES